LAPLFYFKVLVNQSKNILLVLRAGLQANCITTNN